MARLSIARTKELARRKALLNGAAVHRRVVRRPTFVGVTGSCGKSTTVVLASHVLGRIGGVMNGAVIDSTNDNERVAVSVLKTKPTDSALVVELSGHQKGMLDFVSERLRIDVAIVTHIQADHYTNFRGLEYTAEEKGKIVRTLRPGGVAVLNTDDEHVWRMRHLTDERVIGIGLSPEADLRAVEVRADWPGRLSIDVVHDGTSVTVDTQLVGPTGVVPVLAAMAVGLTQGMTLDATAEAVAEVVPVPGRMDPATLSTGAVLIDDSWKAPVYSMDEASSFLGHAEAQRTIMIIGTLSDSPGKRSRQYRRVTARALETADQVVVVGKWGSSLQRIQDEVGDRLVTVDTTRDVQEWVAEHTSVGDVVLLKGSCRLDHLERLALHDVEPVTCWTQTCGKPLRCESCSELRAGVPVSL